MELPSSPVLGGFLGINVGHRAGLYIIHPKLQHKFHNGFGGLLLVQPLGTTVDIGHISELIRVAAVIVHILTTAQGKLGQSGQFLVPTKSRHPGSRTEGWILSQSHCITEVIQNGQ